MVGGKLLAAIISAKGIARFISPPHIPTMYSPHKPSKNTSHDVQCHKHSSISPEHNDPSYLWQWCGLGAEQREKSWLKGLFFIFVHLFIHIHCLAKLNKIECLLILFDPKIGFSNGWSIASIYYPYFWRKMPKYHSFLVLANKINMVGNIPENYKMPERWSLILVLA